MSTSEEPFRSTSDRRGKRCYVLASGQIVTKDGAWPLPVTVLYAPEVDGRQDYGMVDTVREGKAWARHDAAARAAALLPRRVVTC